MPYRLLHVSGSVEPFLLEGVIKTLEEMDDVIIQLMCSGDYHPMEDGLFRVDLDDEGKLIDIYSFSAKFMEEMEKRAYRANEEGEEDEQQTEEGEGEKGVS